MAKECLLGVIPILLFDGVLVSLFRQSIQECFDKNNVEISKSRKLFFWLLLNCDFQQIKKQKREILIVHKLYIFYTAFSLLFYLSLIFIYLALNPTVCFYVIAAGMALKFISVFIVRIVLFPNGIRSYSIFSKRYKKK